MANQLASHLAWRIAESVRPVLSQRASLRAASAVLKDKGEDHTAHRIDQIAEQVLFDELANVGFSGLVFSEESGLTRLGSDARLLVCDPYCNTTLTFRGIRESAVAVYEFSSTNKLISGAIADLQMPRIVVAHNERASARVLWPYEGDASRTVRVSDVKSLDRAFVVVSLLKAKRRRLAPALLLTRPSYMSVIDGAIVALRIAVGEVDGFVDAHVGQPTYEALAYSLVLAAGGVVTDSSGAPINFSELVDLLRAEQVLRHEIVAAASSELLDEIRDCLI